VRLPEQPGTLVSARSPGSTSTLDPLASGDGGGRRLPIDLDVKIGALDVYGKGSTRSRCAAPSMPPAGPVMLTARELGREPVPP